MNDHSETRTLRLECLESRALLSADGWGEFTQDVERSHHTERASEQSALKHHDRHLKKEDSRGSERDKRESRDAARGQSQSQQHQVRFEIRHDRVRLRFVMPFHKHASIQPTLASSSTPEGEAVSDQGRAATDPSAPNHQPNSSLRVSNAAPSLTASRPAVLDQRSAEDPPQQVGTRTPIETTQESESNQVAVPANAFRETMSNLLAPAAATFADTAPSESAAFQADNRSLTPLENRQHQPDNAPSSVSSSIEIEGGWVDDIGFPEDLRFVPSPSFAPTTPSLLGGQSSVEVTASWIPDSIPFAHDAAIDSLSAANALIDLSERIVEFRPTDAHSGLIDMGLRATLGVHRSLDVIEGDFNVDETDLRDLVLAALTREIDAESTLRGDAIRLPRINYAGAAILAASLTTITHRRRRSEQGGTASPQRPPRK